MIDPMQIRLAKVLYQERLQAAEQARQRASWIPGPGLFDRLHMAIGWCVITLRRQVKTPATRQDPSVILEGHNHGWF
jgi:hypothetical protein